MKFASRVLAALAVSAVGAFAVQDTALSKDDEAFWGRFLEGRSSIGPSPTPGCSVDCDDSDECTIDSCSLETGCEHSPVSCAQNEDCDQFDGQCKPIDSLRPCIAVIDESQENGINNGINLMVDSIWAKFRANYPDRPFCLLQPEPNQDLGNLSLSLPTNPDFLSDQRTTYSLVNRDEGVTSMASDWFNICGLSQLNSTGIDFVGLFIDISISLGEDEIMASYEKFLGDLESANLSYCTVANSEEDWITPFDTTLGEIGGGGECVVTQETPTQVECEDDSDCVDASEYMCESNKCVLRGCEIGINAECCNDADCDSGYRCASYKCVKKGNPSFSLTWFGNDDLDLHVLTPGGVEIFFDEGHTFDPVSGGELDEDDIPSDFGNLIQNWAENVNFPLVGSPEGTYTFWVHNYEEIAGNGAESWELTSYIDDTVENVYHGVLAYDETSERFTLTR